MYYMVFRYDVCLEKYMNLSVRLINGTELKGTKPKRRIESIGSKQNNNLTYSSRQQNTNLATTLFLQRN